MIATSPHEERPRPEIRLPARILGTASLLPGRPRTTREIAAGLSLQRDVGEWEARTGIHARHWAPPGTLVAPLAAECLRAALDAAGQPTSALRRIIFVSSFDGDRTGPATANLVAAGLGLSGSCDAFDLNNACMGFLSAFDIAARSVATGLGPVGIVSGELCSRIIRPDDHRPYLVFGDAIAAAVIGPARPGEGVVASAYGNDGTLPPDVFIESPLLTGRREYVQFRKSSAEIFEIAFNAMRAGIEAVLDQARTRIADVEWVVTHQPNGAMVDRLLARLSVDPTRTVRVVDTIGSVASASLPVGLDRLLRTRPVRPGDRILMAGVGGGVAHGAVLYQVGG
jgi:3-oxoacyl-(acyl-carrier-protein) synthase III